MSQYNHLSDKPATTGICVNCHGVFKYTVSDDAYYGGHGHDWEYIKCPWCDTENGRVHGGEFLSVYVTKVEV